MPGSFFDTNALLCVASGDPATADRAEELIGAGGTMTAQVLNEIADVARRKMGIHGRRRARFLP
jgi:predicted nucleic acid-binding protein